jgi:hypothetical protein
MVFAREAPRRGFVSLVGRSGNVAACRDVGEHADLDKQIAAILGILPFKK